MRPFAALLLPTLALAAPLRRPIDRLVLHTRPSMQQPLSLPRTSTGHSDSPPEEVESIGVRLITESVHEEYTEVVEVLAQIPVGEKVLVRTSDPSPFEDTDGWRCLPDDEDSLLPCAPNKMEIVSVPRSNPRYRHICVVHSTVGVREEVDGVKISMPASVIVSDTDGVVDMYAGADRGAFDRGQTVGSFECF